MAEGFQVKSAERIKTNYLLFSPKGYEKKSGKRCPLILFLHGAGERGNDIWKVATHGPHKHIREHPDFPFMVVSPQCPENRIWSKEVLLALLDEITDKYEVDTSRIYLTGVS